MALPNLPQSRNEKYLAKIAGQEVELPNEPLSREEQYLDYIAKNGGGGGGYVLPTATELRLGGVKIGSGINVEEDGTISANIPTKVSDLDNDEDFISDADYVHTDNNYDDNAKGIVDGVTEALAGKQDELTFDNVPTANSTNPVKSGGVYAADEAIRKWTTAEAKSVSGNPITLTDGSARKAEGLSVTCNPKQNLHGYDHPWAGGAGKNKLPMTVANLKSWNTVGSWQGNIYTYNLATFTVDTDDDGNVIGISKSGTINQTSAFLMYATLSAGTYKVNGCPNRSASDNFSIIVKKNNTSGELLAELTSDADASFTLTESITICIYIRIVEYNASNATFYPMIRLASVSDATFEPYSNECPITGYTECVVDRDGKNLLDESQLSSGNLAYLPLNVGSGDFTLSTDAPLNTGSTANLFLLTGNVSVGINTNTNGVWNGQSRTVTATDGYVTIASRNLDGVNPHDYHTMLERGTSASPYVPYSHATATIAFGQTLYGGSVDFKTGKVTVTHKFKQFDGSENWQDSTNGYVLTRVNGDFADIKIASNANTPIITNMFQNGSTTWTNGKAGVDNGTLWIGDASQSTYGGLASFKTFLSNNNLQMAYPLATPTELTLTPAELELLKGYNYISTNGTTIALNYLPDSLLAEAENYVDAKIPPALSSVTVTADGSKSVAQLLNDLFQLVDMTKITSESKLIRVTSTSTVVYHIVEYTASSLYYSYDVVTSEHWQVLTFILKDDDSSYHQVYDNTRYDKSSDVPTSGTTFAIYY